MPHQGARTWRRISGSACTSVRWHRARAVHWRTVEHGTLHSSCAGLCSSRFRMPLKGRSSVRLARRRLYCGCTGAVLCVRAVHVAVVMIVLACGVRRRLRHRKRDVLACVFFLSRARAPRRLCALSSFEHCAARAPHAATAVRWLTWLRIRSQSRELFFVRSRTWPRLVKHRQ